MGISEDTFDLTEFSGLLFDVKRFKSGNTIKSHDDIVISINIAFEDGYISKNEKVTLLLILDDKNLRNGEEEEES